MALSLVMSISPRPGAAVAVAPRSLKVAMPAYIFSDDLRGWESIIDRAADIPVAVINPRNGPNVFRGTRCGDFIPPNDPGTGPNLTGLRMDDTFGSPRFPNDPKLVTSSLDYLTTLSQHFIRRSNAMTSAGIGMYGYVWSNTNGADPGCSRTPAIVGEEIDLYRTRYGINNVFLDDASPSCPNVVRKEMADLAHAKGAKVILNPGTIAGSCLANEGDIIVNFEGKPSAYAAARGSLVANAALLRQTNPNVKIWHIIYASTDADIDAVIAQAQTSADYLYITDDIADSRGCDRGNSQFDSLYGTWPIIRQDIPSCATRFNGSTRTFSSVVDSIVRPAAPSRYDYVPEGRLLDTRSAGQTVDGVAMRAGLRPAGSVTRVPISGRVGVATNPGAVVLNVTVVDAQADGYLSAYPCGATPPIASNINFIRGQTIANLVVSPIGEGSVCLFTSGGAQLLADLTGVTPSGGSFVAQQVPARLLDTRASSTTVDGQSQSLGLRVGGSVTEVSMIGRSGIGNDADTVVMNVAAVDPEGNGYVSVYPCGSNPPIASNLNFVRGQTIANSAYARVGNFGRVCIFNSATTHLLVDVSGYYPRGTFLTSNDQPIRLLDTRSALSTFDGQNAGGGPKSADSVTRLPVNRVSAGARGVVVNVTAVNAGGDGFLTVYPCASRPNVSQLNFRTGQTVANLVIAELSSTDEICMYTSARTDLIVDATAYFAA